MINIIDYQCVNSDIQKNLKLMVRELRVGDLEMAFTYFKLALLDAKSYSDFEAIRNKLATSAFLSDEANGFYDRVKDFVSETGFDDLEGFSYEDICDETKFLDSLMEIEVDQFLYSFNSMYVEYRELFNSNEPSIIEIKRLIDRFILLKKDLIELKGIIDGEIFIEFNDALNDTIFKLRNKIGKLAKGTVIRLK